jgi:CBS domain containing-hemolysin-like protein
MLITNLNDQLDIALPHEQAHTIGGLIMAILGRVPQVGDVVEVDGIHLRVKAVAYRSVTSVCITLPEDLPGFEPQEVAQ